MSRFSRVNTIWRKELSDTLRDRRTLLAMVLVPMVLYPALMLGSLQAFESNTSALLNEEYTIAVESDAAGAWIQAALKRDAGRREIVATESTGDPTTRPTEQDARRSRGAMRESARERPPQFEFIVVPDAAGAVKRGAAHLGLRLVEASTTQPEYSSTQVQVFYDETDVRSQTAAAGVDGVLTRAANFEVLMRLRRAALPQAFAQPILVVQQSVATPEKRGGSVLGQIVPLILVIMTISGAIYPAIDLTAGERERGTLETLMVAPVPTVDLIAGKFVVVALIGMLSASLNLLSVGGTIYLGGLGQLLTRGSEAVAVPYYVLPAVLLVLLPMAIMFSAILLAVCSFARSFKEAQNYIMPVMVAAMIPAIVGVLPGARLEGPLLIMPVANIVLLTRDLFAGRFESAPLFFVLASTSLYAGAAIAVAAKLFGQEAVLFADSGSIRTIFQRRFFEPARHPSLAQAFLMLALLFSLNYFIQVAMGKSPALAGTIHFFYGVAAVMMVLFFVVPMATAIYMRVDVSSAFALAPPSARALAAAVCFGLSTWVLAGAWFYFQRPWLPMPPEFEQQLSRTSSILLGEPLPVALLLAAIVPALCEEFFFRGFALSGVRRGLGPVAAVLIVALAFGVYHCLLSRLVVTWGLGVLLGLLVVRFGSLWPAMLVHMLHNGLSIAAAHPAGLSGWLAARGFTEDGPPPLPWLLGAAGLTLVGIVLCAIGGARADERAQPASVGARVQESRA